MKIEAKFYSENNSLFFLDGSKAEPNTDQVAAIQVKWSDVGMDEDSYNEEYLANLRDQLKALEEKGTYGFVVPVCDADCDSAEKQEAFTASMKHCARRIKDCENIVGFAVPGQVDCGYYMEELSAKHKHYIYFTDNAELLKSNGNIVKY
ncbi:MAG: hypothetical protein KBS64_00325 [Treponema sp.]|nr:hypothetical protein [Candidatus Treponema equi]